MSMVIPFSLQAAAVLHLPAPAAPAADAPCSLLGTWHSRGPTRAVTFTIRPAGPGLTVSAVAAQDGEEAEVTAVARHGGIISFRLRWRSSGEICQCALQAVAPDCVQSTCTHVEHQVLERQPV